MNHSPLIFIFPGKILLLLNVILVSLTMYGGEWSRVEERIASRWAKEITPSNAWQEYPRPQFQRQEWINLNGLWDLSIQEQNEPMPANYTQKILVPFCVESALSGIGREIYPEDRLWYRKTFHLPDNWESQEVIINFEAVDYESAVWINGAYVGSHKGGFDRFSFKITPYLTIGGEQEVVVAVNDPTSYSPQPRGKQSHHESRITYSPVSGIWQTVWLEAVSGEAYLGEARIIPDIDNQTVSILPLLDEASKSGYTVRVRVSDLSGLVSEETGPADEVTELKIPSPRLWSPDDPFLYDLHLALINPEGEVIDKVNSYMGMRKISLGNHNGTKYLFLNNEPLFHYGTLDQGWWPAGLMTPPSDEAMRYDIEITKRMGFNMIRKHLKVEPERWYYHCDKIGLLVWQDMPSGQAVVDKNPKGRPQPIPVTRRGEPDAHRNTLDAAQFELELRRMIDLHVNSPSIVMWVVFNEGWGQYDTMRITEAVQNYDPSRLVNAASGWANRPVGDIHDIHSYEIETQVPPISLDKASVLGEYGGIGMLIDDHVWSTESQRLGEQSYDSKEELLENYHRMFDKIIDMERSKGLSAAVYTQITDVEGELNGLMTYDREVLKIPPGALRNMHEKLFSND
jgi:beta-galactosidase/beta-glucuronidase